MTATTFNEMLHALRGDALAAVPRGAATFLSAGCAGAWYFDWIAERYPGIERHVGVEYYSPKPEHLPANAEWIRASVADMSPVASESVDLLFSGQNIEHLPEPDIGAFLREAHRTLRPGGMLVIDSPNRAITERLGWFQPEHVIEFRVDEIRTLVELAGFDIESIKGLWQCYDPSSHRVLPLDPGTDERASLQRMAAASDDPENAFAWWLIARKSARAGDWAAIDAAVGRIAGQAYASVRCRYFSQIGRIAHEILQSEARGPQGTSGFLLYGPYMPLFPGRYHVVFRVRRTDGAASGQGRRTLLGHVDVSSAYAKRDIARRDMTAADLAVPGPDGYCAVALAFELEDALFGTEFRVFTTGAAALAAALPLQVTRLP